MIDSYRLLKAMWSAKCQYCMLVTTPTALWESLGGTPLFVLCYSIVILLLLLLVLPDNVTNTQHTPQCTVGKFRGGPHYLVAEHFFL